MLTNLIIKVENMKTDCKKMTHRELTTEWVDGKDERLLKMTQVTEVNKTQALLIHPSQLISICNEFGLMSSDCLEKKTIEKLQRRMVMVQTRMETLHASLSQSSLQEYPDLAWDMLYTSATLDLIDDFCLDIEHAI